MVIVKTILLDCLLDLQTSLQFKSDESLIQSKMGDNRLFTKTYKGDSLSNNHGLGSKGALG